MSATEEGRVDVEQAVQGQLTAERERRGAGISSSFVVVGSRVLVEAPLYAAS